jgi:tRNA pseudouridine55 synthase
LILSAQLNGLLLVDKPQDFTSHDVVAQLRKILGMRAIGHTGTLDPLATGLMVVVLGEATKLSDYLTAADKSYSLKIKLGTTTDSLDRTGKILSEKDGRVESPRLREAVAALEGEFGWQVPLFSAAKVDGKKLYEHGRAGTGEEVIRPTKKMKFWDVKILELGEDRLEVSLHCSKGSFVRTWASQLGESLGTGAVVEELRRLSVGAWEIGSASTLEQLANKQGEWPSFVPMGQALPGIRPVVASPREIKLVVNGQIPRDLGTRLMFEQKQAIQTQLPVYIKVLTGAGDLLAILAAEPGQGLKIRRVFRGLSV